MLGPGRYTRMRGFQIRSQNWDQITFDPVFVKKKTAEIWQICLVCWFLSVFDSFWAKNGVKCCRFQFCDKIWNPLILASFWPQNVRNLKTLFFWPSIVSPKLQRFCADHYTSQIELKFRIVFWHHKATFETLTHCTFLKMCFSLHPSVQLFKTRVLKVSLQSATFCAGYSRKKGKRVLCRSVTL